MKILIIDYGMGNLFSVKKSFEKCGADAFVSADPKDINQADKVVLPGVGAFKSAIDRLKKYAWFDAIRKACCREGKPMLGICLGMQLLADKSDESSNGQSVEGLGIIPGHVKRFTSTALNERIPHVGWNEVHFRDDHALFDSIRNGSDFYFVHSYHFIPSDDDYAVSHTPYCGKFVSSINKNNIFGVQFHPEKSSHCGLQLIKNFINN